jgi:hypothetical protein
MLPVAVLMGPGACGGDSSGGGTAGNGAADAGAGSGGLSDAGAGGAQADGTADDAALDAGMFACIDCFCDGKTHYCLDVEAGGASGWDAATAACSEPDAGENGCTKLPDSCGTTPVCACLPLPSPSCVCTETGGGFLVRCTFA